MAKSLFLFLQSTTKNGHENVILDEIILYDLFWTIFLVSLSAQGNQVAFRSVPKSGTALAYKHHDDDLICLLLLGNY